MNSSRPTKHANNNEMVWIDNHSHSKIKISTHELINILVMPSGNHLYAKYELEPKISELQLHKCNFSPNKFVVYQKFIQWLSIIPQ